MEAALEATKKELVQLVIKPEIKTRNTKINIVLGENLQKKI